jgi:hypothetical protein
MATPTPQQGGSNTPAQQPQQQGGTTPSQPAKPVFKDWAAI